MKLPLNDCDVLQEGYQAYTLSSKAVEIQRGFFASGFTYAVLQEHRKIILFFQCYP